MSFLGFEYVFLSGGRVLIDWFGWGGERDGREWQKGRERGVESRGRRGGMGDELEGVPVAVDE